MRSWKIIIVAVCTLAVVAGFGAFFLAGRYRLDPAEAWTYTSPGHGFTIRIPSGDWKPIPKPEAEVGFHDAKHSALAAVSARKETQKLFESESIPRMKSIIEPPREDYLSAPFYKEGTTAAGNPYAFWKVKSKTKDGVTVFVAHSVVWCRNKQLTVAVTMEGQLKMKSQTGSSAELDYFEKAADLLCLSAE
jgi:hypothetical protein